MPRTWLAESTTVEGTTATPQPAAANAMEVCGVPLSRTTRGRMRATRHAVSNQSRFQRTFTFLRIRKYSPFCANGLMTFWGLPSGTCAIACLSPAIRRQMADLSMAGYLFFPKDESGYDLAASHPAVHGWLDRIAALPGWRAPYDLLPGKRLHRYA
jgi:hypothetical protein